jgi:hypothetical protein
LSKTRAGGAAAMNGGVGQQGCKYFRSSRIPLIAAQKKRVCCEKRNIRRMLAALTLPEN